MAALAPAGSRARRAVTARSWQPIAAARSPPRPAYGNATLNLIVHRRNNLDNPVYCRKPQATPRGSRHWRRRNPRRPREMSGLLGLASCRSIAAMAASSARLAASAAACGSIIIRNSTMSLMSWRVSSAPGNRARYPPACLRGRAERAPPAAAYATP